jgi:hypothetical protein
LETHRSNEKKKREEKEKSKEGSRGLSASLTLHSFSETLFALGFRLFLIQLQINIQENLTLNQDEQRNKKGENSTNRKEEGKERGKG